MNFGGKDAWVSLMTRCRGEGRRGSKGHWGNHPGSQASQTVLNFLVHSLIHTFIFLCSGEEGGGEIQMFFVALIIRVKLDTSYSP